MAAHLRAGDDLGASGLSGDTDFTSSNLSSYSAGPPALVAKPQQQRGDGAGYDGGPHISYGDAEHGDDLDRQSRSSANSAFLASQRFQAGKLGAEEELDEFGAMLADTTGSRANLALSRLHLAAGTGDIAMVQSLLAEAAEAQDLQLLEDEDSLGRTPLIYGILANHLEVCEQLLSAGSDPNQRDADGRNAGHLGAFHQTWDIMESLFRYGLDPTQVDNEGRLLFHWAAINDQPHTLSAILNACVQFLPGGMDELLQLVSAKDSYGLTPMHWSVHQNCPDNIELFLRAGADAQVADNEGKTALHWTSSHQDTNCALQLLEHDQTLVTTVDHAGQGTLHLAVGDQNVELVELLVRIEHTDLSLKDNSGRTPAHWASTLGDASVLGVLTQARADLRSLDEHGATALHYAAQHNHLECIALLVASSPELCTMGDTDGRLPLTWAISQGNNEAVGALLKSAHNLDATDTEGRSALHAAAYVDNADAIALLVQAGASLDAQDETGQSALMTAAEMGAATAAAALLQLECNADLVDQDSKTALHLAAVAGHTGVIAIFLADGAQYELNPIDSRGETPLHYAAFYGHGEAVALLLTKAAGYDGRLQDGVFFDLQDAEGVTPLHWACLQGHADCARLLLDKGVFPNYQEFEGNRSTPVDYATQSGSADILAMLEEFGGMSTEALENYAAVTIQASARGFLARKMVNSMAKQMELHAAEVLIQKRNRDAVKRQASVVNESTAETIVHAADKFEAALVPQLKESDGHRRRDAAVVIQSAFRSWLARKELQRRRQARQAARAAKAATIAAGTLAQPATSDREGDREAKYAVIIQCAVRVWLASRWADQFRKRKAADAGAAAPTAADQPGDADVAADAGAAAPEDAAAPATTLEQLKSAYNQGADAPTAPSAPSSRKSSSKSSRANSRRGSGSKPKGVKAPGSKLQGAKEKLLLHRVVNAAEYTHFKKVPQEETDEEAEEAENAAAYRGEVAAQIARTRTRAKDTRDDFEQFYSADATHVSAESKAVLTMRFLEHRKEKSRVQMIRQKQRAALLIQRWFRKKHFRRTARNITRQIDRRMSGRTIFKEMERPMGHRGMLKTPAFNSEVFSFQQREIAALTIQLWWRKWRRRQLEAEYRDQYPVSLSSYAAHLTKSAYAPGRHSVPGFVIKTWTPKENPHRAWPNSVRVHDRSQRTSAACVSYNNGVDIYKQTARVGNPSLFKQKQKKYTFVLRDGVSLKNDSSRPTSAPNHRQAEEGRFPPLASRGPRHASPGAATASPPRNAKGKPRRSRSNRPRSQSRSPTKSLRKSSSSSSTLPPLSRSDSRRSSNESRAEDVADRSANTRPTSVSTDYVAQQIARHKMPLEVGRVGFQNVKTDLLNVLSIKKKTIKDYF